MRLFIALKPPATIVKQLTVFFNNQPANLRTSGRWVRAEQLHVTVGFLGEVKTNLLPQLLSAINEVRNVTNEFNLTMDKFSWFPSSRPRLGQITFKSQAVFTTLQQTLQSALAKVKVELSVSPAHLTVVR